MGPNKLPSKRAMSGMEVVYDGIRLTPQEIVQSARDEGVHVIGLSILSGSHGVLVVDVVEQLRKRPASAMFRSWLGGSFPKTMREDLQEGRGQACLHTQGLRSHPNHG